MELDVADMQILILGCGYTGRRVAQRFLERGAQVVATTRSPDDLADLADAGAEVHRLDMDEPATLRALRDLISPGVRVLHSVPVIGRGDDAWDPTPRLLDALDELPARIVYISTTGVYGPAVDIDETTPVEPLSHYRQCRVDAEKAVLNGPWAALVLRPPAIYGPGRGIHVSMREGRYKLIGDGMDFVSRIHVDDLAAHCEAGLLVDEVTGAYPVGDERPAPKRDVAAFTAELLDVPMPPFVPADENTHPSRRVSRCVDGSAIRRLLGIELEHPSYRVGIPASVAAEKR